MKQEAPVIPSPAPAHDANWIWRNERRTLANSVVLFRRRVRISESLQSARGWIYADSRYRLFVDGQRIQTGPAPCDPRTQELDPVDLTQALSPGEHILGIEVLYFGHGDGTWAMGAPGLLLSLDLTYPDDHTETLVSDESWNCCLNPAYAPGQYKRWFLRSLQEIFDARKLPESFWQDDTLPWQPAIILSSDASRSSLAAGGPEYVLSPWVNPADTVLKPRSLPLLEEQLLEAEFEGVGERLQWASDPDAWFDQFSPPGWEPVGKSPLSPSENGIQISPPEPGQSTCVSFSLEQETVGYPWLRVEAPEGTVIEILWTELPPERTQGLFPSPYFDWSRVICRGGLTEWVSLEYESIKRLQLHIREHTEPIRILGVGLIQRQLPFPHRPGFDLGEPALNRLMAANVQTLRNACQETIVDGMARERQQYSGDCSHVLYPLRSAFGETGLPLRFFETFGQGLTPEGYFLDCWPGFDRLARVMQMQMGATQWGPILDHGLQFAMDHWTHTMETGETSHIETNLEKLIRFGQYLRSITDLNGCCKVDDLGYATVWLDHYAYNEDPTKLLSPVRTERKQCPFTLQVIVTLRHALVPLCQLSGREEEADAFSGHAERLEEAVVQQFWDPQQKLFINNRPWLKRDGRQSIDDRSLAIALLYDLCPDGQTRACAEALAGGPPTVAFSYPANAIWRHRAWVKTGRIDCVLDELRNRWATMPSVKHNLTLAENFGDHTETEQQWSHCPTTPLAILHEGLAGIQPLRPGYEEVLIQPQLGDLKTFNLVHHTPHGPIELKLKQTPQGLSGSVHIPNGIAQARLRLPSASEGGRIMDLSPGWTDISPVRETI